MTQKPEIKVGDTYYVFDENRRVYARDKHGNSFGSPIYREYFRPTEIVGETSRSWLYGAKWSPQKVSKKDPWRVFKTEQIVDDECWDHDHRHTIINMMNRGGVDTEMLRKIAELIGFKP